MPSDFIHRTIQLLVHLNSSIQAKYTMEWKSSIFKAFVQAALDNARDAPAQDASEERLQNIA